MKASELREQTPDDLRRLRQDVLKEQFNLRMQKTTTESRKPHLIKRARRQLARIETVLHEMMGEQHG